MVSKVKEFVSEQQQVLSRQARKLGRAPGKVVRNAAARSAKRIKALQEPVRVVTHSGVKLTNVSHEALLGLMALQLEVVTSALSNAASQLERVAQSDNVMDLVRGQADESARDPRPRRQGREARRVDRQGRRHRRPRRGDRDLRESREAWPGGATRSEVHACPQGEARCSQDEGEGAREDEALTFTDGVVRPEIFPVSP